MPHPDLSFNTFTLSHFQYFQHLQFLVTFPAHPDLSNIYLVAESSCSGSIVREDGRPIAVTIRVDQLDCLQRREALRKGGREGPRRGCPRWRRRGRGQRFLPCTLSCLGPCLQSNFIGKSILVEIVTCDDRWPHKIAIGVLRHRHLQAVFWEASNLRWLSWKQRIFTCYIFNLVRVGEPDWFQPICWPFKVCWNICPIFPK